MTRTLQQAFDKAAALPPERQDTLAAILIEEIESEDRWQQSFARSQDVLSKLAAEALEEDAKGLTRDLNELL
jgi:predicted lipid-binding transport protein (Tim44 family)